MYLTNAALDATELLLPQIPSGQPFRVIYVLNTDGEASDGLRAGSAFMEGYARLRNAHSHMLEARTFVLGIGANHDQKVLGAMSVGEASYYNYPDNDLMAMVGDAQTNILPELSGNIQMVPLSLNVSGTINTVGTVREDASTETGYALCLDLSGIRVSPGDSTITAPNGEVYEIEVETIDETDERYFELCLQAMQDEALRLLKAIKAAAQEKRGQTVAPDLSSALTALGTRLQLLRDPVVQEVGSLADAVRQSRSAGGEEESKTSSAAARRSQIYATVRARMKKLRGGNIDRKAAVKSVLVLCEAGLQSLRIGSALSTEVERDFMEVLGSGGFQHWTAKKKSRVTNRALGQVNSDAIELVDAAVAKILRTNATQPTPQTPATAQDMEGEGDSSAAGQSSYDHSYRRQCWLTLMGDEELTETGDVLCMVGYVPKGARNLPLCAVSSAKVLHNSILNGHVEICPHPMSFLTLRELLIEGNEISRGPNGRPINTAVCLLPSSAYPVSAELASSYAPLVASQLLTSRWIYTEVIINIWQ